MSQSNGINQKRVPIRRRVMTIVMMTTLITFLAASVTGLICIHWIKNASEDALTQQLETNLKSVVEQKAVSADVRLEHYEKYIEFVTDYIESMYTEQDKMIEQGRVFDPPRNTKEYALTRAFATKAQTEEKLDNEIRFFSNLEQIWEPIAKENENLITTVYAGTKNGLLTSYDRWSYMSAVPEGEELYYDYFDSDWYKQGMKEKDVFYTSLYVDSQGRGLTITLASPFHNAKGQVVGVDSADFDITGLYDELLSIDLGDGTVSFALDQDGAIISPDAENKSVKEYTGLTEKQLEKLRNEDDGILETKNAVYVCIPIKRVGWTLCASVPTTTITDSIHEADQSIRFAYLLFIVIALLIIIAAVLAVNKAAASITRPMEILGRDMKIIADGDLNYRAEVMRNDEIGDITMRMNEMVDRLQLTMTELTSTQEHADAMSRLAIHDSLTGIRNKMAFDEEEQVLEQKLADGHKEFGFVMVDLNNLKEINDRYGHDKGDITIKKLCSLICETFDHSPVFRVGGDEFVVILENMDYKNVTELVTQFEKTIEDISGQTELEPWDRISAAIGYALYDESEDTGADSVLTRADMEMYRCKRTMKMQKKLR